MIDKLNIKKVITHNGYIHRDDLICAALGLALSDKEIPWERKNDISAQELYDKEILICDVGKQHDPDYLLFDHHQITERPNDCGFSLLAKYLGLHEAFLTQKWYKISIIHDVRGEESVAKYLGLKEVPQGLLSPIEGAIHKIIEDIPKQNGIQLITPDMWVWKMVRALGGSILRHVMGFKMRLDHLEDSVDCWTIEGQSKNVEVLLLKENDITGLPELRNKKYPGAALSITLDSKGPGWSVYKFSSHPDADLTKLKDMEEFSYVSEKGHLAKTKEMMPLKRLFDLVSKAIK